MVVLATWGVVGSPAQAAEPWAAAGFDRSSKWQGHTAEGYAVEMFWAEWSTEPSTGDGPDDPKGWFYLDISCGSVAECDPTRTGQRETYDMSVSLDPVTRETVVLATFDDCAVDLRFVGRRIETRDAGVFASPSGSPDGYYLVGGPRTFEFGDYTGTVCGFPLNFDAAIEYMPLAGGGDPTGQSVGGDQAGQIGEALRDATRSHPVRVDHP